ncbi:MAG: hypothetical protein ABJ092_02060 [Gillisia sp.]
MKYAEFKIDSHRIEYWNSLFGIEKILVEGTEVSKRFSFFGTRLRFELNSDNYILSSSYPALGKRKIKLKLEKNGNLVGKLDIDPNPNQRIYWWPVIIIAAYLLFNAFYLK